MLVGLQHALSVMQVATPVLLHLNVYYAKLVAMQCKDKDYVFNAMQVHTVVLVQVCAPHA